MHTNSTQNSSSTSVWQIGHNLFWKGVFEKRILSTERQCDDSRNLVKVLCTAEEMTVASNIATRMNLRVYKLGVYKLGLYCSC